MQFMDDAIWTVLQQGIVSPHEAYMKAIDKNRFKSALANSAGVHGISASRHGSSRGSS
jgi:hypothetical protein